MPPRLRPEVHIVGADTDEAQRMIKPLQIRLIGGNRGLVIGTMSPTIHQPRHTPVPYGAARSCQPAHMAACPFFRSVMRHSFLSLSRIT